MSFSVKEITYTDPQSFSTELEFTVACSRVEGVDLLKLSLLNSDMANRFRSTAAKLLRAMKRDGVIKLFVFESELNVQEKMESVYLLNKFPELSLNDKLSETDIYIKL